MHGVLLVVQGFDIWYTEIICYFAPAFIQNIYKTRGVSPKMQYSIRRGQK